MQIIESKKHKNITWRKCKKTRSHQLAIFVQYDAKQGGAPTSGLMIVKGLIASGWRAEAVFGDNGPMITQYEALGCRTQIIRHGQWLVGGNVLRRLRRWGTDLLASYAFLRLMCRLQPDLVYINTLTGLSPALAARVLGIPCVWHIRELFKEVGGEVHDPLGGRRMVHWALRLTSRRIIAVSRAVVKNVFGCDGTTPVTIITNAVAEEFFSYCTTRRDSRFLLGLPMDTPIIGIPGTLRPVKGHPFFLKAAREVATRHPNCHYIISGDGDHCYRHSLLAQIAALGLGDRVHFLGTMKDMRPFYCSCDLVCVPSVSEAFPRTVIETFALGLPLVATRVGGITEIVEHGKTGILVPYGDCEALAGQLIRLLEEPQSREAMAQAARRKAEECYREAAYQRRILEVVEDVTTENGNGRRS